MGNAPDAGRPSETEMGGEYNLKKALEVWLGGQTEISATSHAEVELFIESLNPELTVKPELLKVYTDMVLKACQLIDQLADLNRKREELGGEAVGTQGLHELLRTILKSYADYINAGIDKLD